ncbi:MAG: hypothetical protein FWB96_06460 [Defluviitaleaceae bacterium]|nr:hypothetical protein [Defluviitaleaceae bacterium]MCL2263812.1 hypothetical protein [Defluviitaleaceae bacterium]
MLGEKHTYAGTPSYEYRVANFTLDKNGTLIFDSATIEEEQLRQVLDALKAEGFVAEDGMESTEAEKPDFERISIAYPRAGLSEDAIANIHKMVEAKTPLIKMALGVDEIPIEVRDTDIIFHWFKPGNSREVMDAYSQFVMQIVKTASEKKRITAAVRDFQNPRFSFRVWLISLGMVGSAYSTARRVLCKSLPGNAAWSSGIDPRRSCKMQDESMATSETAGE